jgi:hypothetical protein
MRFLVALLLLSSCQAYRPVHPPRGSDALVIDSCQTTRASSALAAGNIQLQGSLVREIELPVEADGIPLQMALEAAGGLSCYADPTALYVRRPLGETFRIYRVSLLHVETLPPKSLLLFPGDLVWVAPLPPLCWFSRYAFSTASISSLP